MSDDYYGGLSPLEWYALPHHGPWEHELAEACECGGWRWTWAMENDPGHDTSPAHITGLLRNLTDDRVEDAIAALENGLGWAANEDMGSYRWHDDDELLALVREALRLAREVARKPT